MAEEGGRGRKPLVIGVAVVALIVVIAVVASGGGGSDGGTGATSTPAPAKPNGAAASSAAAASAAAASAKAEQAALTALAALGVHAADLPSGWSAQPVAGRPGDDPTDRSMYACLGVPDPHRSVPLEETSAFTRGGSRIASTVLRFTDQSALERDAAIFGNPRLPTCIAQLAKKSAGAGVKVGKATVTEGRGDGPDNEVGSFSLPLTVVNLGEDETTTLQAVFVTGIKVEAEVVFFGKGATITPALRRSVVAAVAGRIGRA